jgi:acyl-CoA synthetase (NDP forming)
VLRDGANRVKFAQVISSGFAESSDGAELERSMLDAARVANIRVIGPNCLGTHSPRGRLTFLDRVSAEPGPVGVLSQSGGLGADIVRRGQNRGIRFSGLVSLGNCADVKLVDLCEYMLRDEHTRVIGLYLESAGEARRLFELMRAARAFKPVVILKGGRTTQGQSVAASHTGALASDYRLWIALARQTGSVLLDTVDEFVDTLLALQMLDLSRRDPTRRVVLFGNGGGTSVLATDHFVERGFDVKPFDAQGIVAMESLKLPAGAMLANPIDVPANAMRHDDGRFARQILQIACRHGSPHAIVIHLNMTILLGYRNSDMLGNVLRAIIETRAEQGGQVHFVLVLRSDGGADVEEARRHAAEKALAAGLAVFDEPHDAAIALAAVSAVERFRSRRGLPGTPAPSPPQAHTSRVTFESQ